MNKFPTSALIIVLLLLPAPGIASENFNGLYEFSGTESERAEHQQVLDALKRGDRGKLPVATIAETLEISLDGSDLTIATPTETHSGPADGTAFVLEDGNGRNVMVKRSLSSDKLVEALRVQQRKLGNSAVRSLVQTTSYSLSEDGRTLSLDIRIDGGRLRQPLDYSLTYVRR